MKTKEQIVSMYSGEEKPSSAFDGRDINRLSEFLTEEELKSVGVTLKEEYQGKHVPSIEWTLENVTKALERDLEFAFDKALGKRGLSASAMFDVIKMWAFILESKHLEDADSNYAQYGLPFLKQIAVEFNLPNPIGDDNGDEYGYSSEADQ